MLADLDLNRIDFIPDAALIRVFERRYGDINRDGYPDIVAGFGSEGGGALRAWAQRPPEATP